MYGWVIYTVIKNSMKNVIILGGFFFNWLMFAALYKVMSLPALNALKTHLSLADCLGSVVKLFVL